MATPRGIRNNNPGNIDFNEVAFQRDPWLGEVGLENHPAARFTTFDVPVHGIRALAKIILTYQRRYDLMTVRGILNRWAPPSENDTESYVLHVADSLGVDADQDIDFSTEREKLETLVAAIIKHENGEQPYHLATIRAGVDMALG